MGKQIVTIAAALLGVAVFFAAAAFPHEMDEMGPMDMTHHAEGPASDAASGMAMHDSHLGHGAMKNMALHMVWSDPRPETAADQARAAKLIATLKSALAKYKDYRMAEADGFKPFHPEFKRQHLVHFTNWWYAVQAQFSFDPAKPTSLLYQRTAEGGYQLIGAMYTAPRRWSQSRLDARVPLSVARWHKHVNLCFPPKRADVGAVDWSKFGPDGSIATKAACDAEGGRFFPVLFGWMVHVYPWESDPAQVWAH